MFSWLALGDSYTIGEGVEQPMTYPFQTAAILRKDGIPLDPPFVIAKTGWTTSELEEAIGQAELKPYYDVVSLLIGVNNQFRELPLKTYESDFERLLKRSITLSGKHSRHVFVLSIPDWGVTPFAQGRDKAKIAAEIRLFNQANMALARRFDTNYINITPLSQEAANDNNLLTADGLHPSGKQYAKWSQLLSRQIKNILG